jgi:protoporphyrinogen oxidase
MPRRTDVLVLGAGVTGLAAATVLTDHAIVVEKDARPGGLVRTERFGRYWFDRVLHLLYFQDRDTEQRIRALMGDTLAPCAPRAWCETSAGITRFPFQMHLGGLDSASRDRCIQDLIAVSQEVLSATPTNFEEHLLGTFGRAMCEIFLFPYNRKMWKRPLRSLAPSGFTWNITPPKLEEVLRGAYDTRDDFRAYNSAGWYPRPPAGAPQRGMELVAAALATQVRDLRTGCTVERVDLEKREAVVRRGSRLERMGYETLLSTLPLPELIQLCVGLPEGLRVACARLKRNRVLSVAMSIRGPRPESPGHWRYYADESMIFTRLVFLHEFDPDLAPANGWPLLIEITEPAEWPAPDPARLFARIREDLVRAQALPEGSKIVDQRLMTIDPAYVVFDVRSQRVVQLAHRVLGQYGVSSVGRYGRWEYSSMSSCMRDGFGWGNTWLQHPEGQELRLAH